MTANHLRGDYLVGTRRPPSPACGPAWRLGGRPNVPGPPSASLEALPTIATGLAADPLVVFAGLRVLVEAALHVLPNTLHTTVNILPGGEKARE